MERRIVIGDIHGCNKTFKKLLFEVLAISSEDKIYVLGDFVDRGPDSIGVINTILELKENAYHIYCLRGNHEQLMIDSCLLYTSPSPRDRTRSRMPSSA